MVYQKNLGCLRVPRGLSWWHGAVRVGWRKFGEYLSAERSSPPIPYQHFLPFKSILESGSMWQDCWAAYLLLFPMHSSSDKESNATCVLRVPNSQHLLSEWDMTLSKTIYRFDPRAKKFLVCLQTEIFPLQSSSVSQFEKLVSVPALKHRLE